MKLYHCARSRSSRVLWLLEELGLSYELEKMPFDPKALQEPDFLEISPLGKIPVLVDEGVTMFESVAIMQYLLRHYGEGRLEPLATAPNYGEYLQWLHFGESTLMGPVSQVLMNTRFLPEESRSAETAERGRRSFRIYADMLNGKLAGRDYLLGDEFTAADIAVGYSVATADLADLLTPKHTNLNAYYERLRERPAFQTAMAD